MLTDMAPPGEDKMFFAFFICPEKSGFSANRQATSWLNENEKAKE